MAGHGHEPRGPRESRGEDKAEALARIDWESVPVHAEPVQYHRLGDCAVGSHTPISVAFVAVNTAAITLALL